MDLNKLELQGEDGLMAVLAGIMDPRKRRGIRHDQASVLAVAVCACLCGMRSFASISEWGKSLSQDLLERLGCRWNFRLARYMPPSEPTVRRTLQSVDAAEVDRKVGVWLWSHGHGDALALDGKTLRGSKTADGKAAHLVSAVLHEERIVVAQQAVSEKSNEITAVQPLLDPLDLNEKVVTADAMHTQVAFAQYLKEKKNADYVFVVKENQPTLLKDIQDLDDQAFSPCIQ